jgi:hypothetical protein
MQTVRQLADSRFDWEQALRDLSRAIPRDVTLSQITGTVTAGATAAGGGSANPLRSAIQAPAVELNGCASSQAGVARLMARLRAVQGVTRVSLASSVKADPQQGTGVADSASGAPAGCGKGSPPTFEMVIFFEGAKAAAGSSAVATRSAAATASATATATPTPAAGTAAATATPAPAGSTSTTAPASGGTQEASTK